MNDLTLALRAAADHATADRAPLPAPPVLSRIHRRRTVRYASQGAVGLAAAGAAVVGGAQVAGRAPEPSPAATGLAESMTVRCGADVDDYTQPGGAPDVSVQLDAYEAEMVEPADGEIPFTVLAEASPEVVEQAGSSLTFALVKDGVIVGLPEAGWVDDSPSGFDEEGLPRLMARWHDVRFGACQEDGAVAGTPEPGTYGVVAFLVPDDGADWPIPFRSNGVVVHLGEATGPAGQRPRLDSLVVSTDGLGAVRLGEAPPAEGSGPVVEWQEKGCVSVDANGGTQVGGRWAATYPLRTTPFGTQTEPFTLVTDDGGRVVRIEVTTSGPRTAAGVQVGDTLSDVVAAHPDALLVGHVDASAAMPGRDLWAVVDGDRTLTFEVATDEPAAPRFTIEPGTVAAIVATLGTGAGDGLVTVGSACVAVTP